MNIDTAERVRDTQFLQTHDLTNFWPLPDTPTWYLCRLDESMEMDIACYMQSFHACLDSCDRVPERIRSHHHKYVAKRLAMVLQY